MSKTNKQDLTKKVDKFYNLIDKACTIHYEDLKMDYIEAFIKVANDLTNEFDEDKLSDEAIDKIKAIYEKIESEHFLNEEVRLACELIIIKGLKHRNLVLDFITPDVINYLYTYIVKAILNYTDYSKKEELVILDTVLGTGNLLQTIINNINEVDIKGVGIEFDELLIHTAKALSELVGNELVINYQDAKNENYQYADIVIGDFGNVRDVYDIILKRTLNLPDGGYFIYLIDNDFFVNCKEEYKKKIKDELTFVGLVVLPNRFTAEGHIGKSILIGKKATLKDYEMAVIKIHEELDKDSFEDAIDKINNMFKNLEGKTNA